MRQGTLLASDHAGNIVLSYDDGSELVFSIRLQTHGGWIVGIQPVQYGESHLIETENQEDYFSSEIKGQASDDKTESKSNQQASKLKEIFGGNDVYEDKPQVKKKILEIGVFEGKSTMNK